jgi:light-regulated signal transduction histidine kinase (bacteriophytochrome)
MQEKALGAHRNTHEICHVAKLIQKHNGLKVLDGKLWVPTLSQNCGKLSGQTNVGREKANRVSDNVQSEQ